MDAQGDNVIHVVDPSPIVGPICLDDEVSMEDCFLVRIFIKGL